MDVFRIFKIFSVVIFNVCKYAKQFYKKIGEKIGGFWLCSKVWILLKHKWNNLSGTKNLFWVSPGVGHEGTAGRTQDERFSNGRSRGSVVSGEESGYRCVLRDIRETQVLVADAMDFLTFIVAVDSLHRRTAVAGYPSFFRTPLWAHPTALLPTTVEPLSLFPYLNK